LIENSCADSSYRWVTALDFSLVDSFTLLSGSEDQTVMVWDIEAEEMGMKEPMKLMQFVSKFVADSFDGGYFISIFSTEINTLQVLISYENKSVLLK
jgi:WD40 repeat protein